MLDYPPQQELLTTSASVARATRLDAGPIQVDLRAFGVTVAGLPVPLTRLEFDLLVYLMRNADSVVVHQELMQQVVQGVYRKNSSLIRVHVAHLRKKLGPGGTLIQTVRGRGFLFRKQD